MMQAPNPGQFMGTALVPAVLISACALLLLSFNNRIVAVLTRQRALHRELRELLQDARKAPAACCGLASAGGSWPSLPSRDMCACGSAAGKDGLLAAATAAAGERYARDEWCTGVQKQIRDLRIEACLIRTAVSFLLAAILLFLASGVLLAASSLNPRCEGPAVGVFLAALAAFALAILLMLSESFLLVHPVLIEERHLKRIISASYVGGACCSGSGGSANSGSHASLTIFAA